MSRSALAGRPRLLPIVEHLADDLVGVFLAHADRVHDVARGHGDFGGVDAVGAEHRAAPAFRALVEIAVPVVEHFLGQVLGADQLRKIFPRQGEMAAIDLAQQVLARDRHVLRIAGAEEIMALSVQAPQWTQESR